MLVSLHGFCLMFSKDPIPDWFTLQTSQIIQYLKFSAQHSRYAMRVVNVHSAWSVASFSSNTCVFVTSGHAPLPRF